MMSLASSAAPPRSLRIWTSLGDLFVEIPGYGGKPPYIERLPCNAKGINLLLSILGAHRTDQDFSGPIPIPSAYRTDPTAPGDPTQQASADRAIALLRKETGL